MATFLKTQPEVQLHCENHSRECYDVVLSTSDGSASIETALYQVATHNVLISMERALDWYRLM